MQIENKVHAAGKVSISMSFGRTTPSLLVRLHYCFPTEKLGDRRGVERNVLVWTGPESTLSLPGSGRGLLI